MNKTKGQTVLCCPDCSEPLQEYALACEHCGADLRTKDIRTSDVIARSINKNEQSIFFYVSPLKLVIMSTVTFGLYDLFWAYKNWSYVNEHTNRRVPVLINAIFRNLTYFWLLKEITLAGDRQNLRPTYPAALLAIAYIVLAICWRLPMPFSFIGWLSCFALVPAQQYVNLLNKDTSTPINSRFTAVNWVAIVIGTIVWVLTIIGAVLPQ
jgi:hypothetical protein